jgi:hypothetical protein
MADEPTPNGCVTTHTSSLDMSAPRPSTEVYVVPPSIRQPMNLAVLHRGCPGMTPAWGTSLSEAARVCLEDEGHASPVEYFVEGRFIARHDLEWPECTDQMRRTWHDLEEATEHGAYGMAALLVATHTDLEVVERSRKGTGFDYWLGPKGQQSLFQSTARLEVSGIKRGDDSAIQSRARKKLKQTEVTDGTLPAFVIVVEFGRPIASVTQK